MRKYKIRQFSPIWWAGIVVTAVTMWAFTAGILTI